MITSRLRTVRDHIRWAVSRFHEEDVFFGHGTDNAWDCLLYTSPSPRDLSTSRMPSSA